MHEVLDFGLRLWYNIANMEKKEMKIAKCFVGAMSVIAAMSANAVELSGWKGETVTALLPCGEKVGMAPAGLAVQAGIAKNVKYTRGQNNEQHLAADRVVWGAEGDGVRVVQVKIAPDAKAGEYVLGDVKVKVVDRVLPCVKKWKYNLDLWQHPWAVARQAGVEPFSDAHFKAMKPVWEMLAAAGQKSLTVTLVDLPWNHQCFDGYGSMIGYTRRADGSTAFDFSLFDRYVQFGKDCGIGPQIACYTMCPWGYKVSWKNEKGEMQKAEAKPGTPFFREYWGPFLVAFSAHLKEKGWLGSTYIALDERTPEDLRNTVEFMKEKAPALKISMAGNRKPSDFNGIEIDCYSQSLGHVNPGFLAEVPQRQKEGKITTYYICCGPGAPNTFMHSGLDEAFWCGAYPAMCGLDGLLRWAWNSWPKNAAERADYGDWAAGDTFLVYPDAQPSMRFLMLFNGIQQAEKFNILKAEGVRKDELAALAAKYDLNAALSMKPGSGTLGGVMAETLKVLNK